MRKNTILSKLAALYAKTGKIPGWKAVEAVGIAADDIYRHWECLTDAVLDADPEARRVKGLKNLRAEEAAAEAKDAREEDAPRGHHYSVYVVNLSSEIGKLQWFADENPNGTKSCLYVGATWHTPEQRLANHKRGHRAARRVAPYMRKINEALTKDHRERYATREEAEREEVSFAKKLRKQGFRVWQR
jgi:predicted GIY-YIG superfamily endonuclease